MQSWKNYQSQIKYKKILQKLLLVGIVGGLIAFLCLGIKFVRSLRSSVNKPSENFLEAEFSTKRPITYLFAEKSTDGGGLAWWGIGSLDYQNKRFNFLLLPSEISLESSQKKYQVNEVLRTGRALNPPRPYRLAQVVVEDYLAFPLDGIIVWQGDRNYLDIQKSGEEVILSTLKETSEEIRTPAYWFRLLRLTRKIRKRTLSNLTWYQIIKGVSLIHSGEVSFSSLSDCAYYGEEEVRDKYVEELLGSTVFSEEGIKVRIRNGTAIAGLAGFGARFVENMGISVLEVDNYERSDLEQSQVFLYTEKDNTKTVERLQGFFGVEEVEKKFSADTGNRFDLDIIVGGDWWRERSLDNQVSQ